MTERKRQVSSVFEEASIPKAVMTLAVPTIITQLINIIYNLADTWYVGRTGNPAMVAALSVSMPVFILMSALANLFGVGGASAVSRSLGMKNEKKARHVFAFCIYGGLCAALLFAAVIACTRSRLIPLIGADESSFGYVYDYMFWTMIIGSVSTVGNVLCGHLVRSIGAAKQAGFGMSMGGILNMILDVGVLAVIVIFQPEIRKFLMKLGNRYMNSAGGRKFINKILGRKTVAQSVEGANDITEACRIMAEDKTGALIVLIHKDPLDEIISTGDRIDALIHRRLITNLFFKNSPLHDGALIVNNGRIWAAACILPVSKRSDLPKRYGLRHRAALGLTEKTDALAIVVSEETGKISIAQGDSIRTVNQSELENWLTQTFGITNEESKTAINEIN